MVLENSSYQVKWANAKCELAQHFAKGNSVTITHSKSNEKAIEQLFKHSSWSIDVLN
jgi:hypothetical protein